MRPPVAVPYQAVLRLTLSSGQRDVSAVASRVVADYLSALRASLEWAQGRETHDDDGAAVEDYIQSFRQSTEHFEKIQDEQTASSEMCLTGDEPNENAGGPGSATVSDAILDIADPGLQRPFKDAVESADRAHSRRPASANIFIRHRRWASPDEDDERAIVRLLMAVTRYSKRGGQIDTRAMLRNLRRGMANAGS